LTRHDQPVEDAPFELAGKSCSSLRSRAVSAVGQRIKRLREERGLSQRDLAEPGVSYAYVSRIEDGQRTPSAKALRKLAEKLGTTALYLETGDASAACPHCGRDA
jgi:ribosome-binding protein aMBF1 (putative translation factor)